MLNKVALINKILNGPSYKAKPIKFGLGYPETGHFINEVGQLGIDLGLPKSKTTGIIISNDCVDDVKARAITSREVKGVYGVTGDASDKSFVIYTMTGERIHVRPVSGSLTKNFMSLISLGHTNYPNLRIFKPVIRLVSLSFSCAANLSNSRIFAFQLCHAIQGSGKKEKIMSGLTEMINHYATRHELGMSHPHFIHGSMVMELIKSAPVGERLEPEQVSQMARLIKQKYTSLANPFNGLMSKLMK